MPVLQARIVSLRPIVAETGPIGAQMPTSSVISSVPGTVGSVFVLKHRDFIDQVNALNHCFGREDITGFPLDELEEHIQVALQDNFIVEDANTGSMCLGNRLQSSSLVPLVNVNVV